MPSSDRNSFERGAITVLTAGQSSVDIWPDSGFDYLGVDSYVSLWLSATVDLVAVNLTLQPPSGPPATIINAGYPVNVENFELDDEWDIAFRDLAVPGDSQLHLLVTSTNAGQLWWKATRRPTGGSGLSMPNIMIDGAISSIPVTGAGSSGTDILLNSILRRRPTASLFTLFASAGGSGLTARIAAQEARLNDIVAAGFPVNVRTQAISAVKDRIAIAEPVAGQSALQGLIVNAAAAAVNLRWHGASVA